MKYDGDFLKKLDNINLKTINVRITSYGMDDSPQEIIEGKVINGSINIDGTSNIRRSCSLTLVAQNININDYYWCFNTRFQIEIGLDNNINDKYPKIIWFNMGYYLIASFNTSINTNGLNISINGKDKMCLLNGEFGGLFEASTSLDIDDFEDQDGTVTHNKLSIKTIITNLIHFYGGEPYHKILINEVPDFGLELQKYQGELPFYLLGSTKTKRVQATTNENYEISYYSLNELTNTLELDETFALKDLPTRRLYYANDLIQDGIRNAASLGDKRIRKIEYGEGCGYKIVDLIYPTDLIASPGESITSILDKIKNFLGPYEYFYDLNGNFVFQKQQKFIPKINYSEESFNPTDNYDSAKDPNTLISYTFDNNNLITNIQNNPNHSIIKNDFTVWGKRKGVNDNEIPIHLRYAIDTIPKNNYESIDLSNPYGKDGHTRARYLLETYPKLFPLMHHETKEMAEKRLILKYQGKIYSPNEYDWRELIYQMAKDYFAFNQIDEFRLWLQTPTNKWIIDGKTGYEQYYTDIEGFWRQIYKTEPEQINIYDTVKEKISYIVQTDEGETKYYHNIIGPYYTVGDKKLITQCYSSNTDNKQLIDITEIIKKNYELFQWIYTYQADKINQSNGDTAKQIQDIYYKFGDGEEDYAEIIGAELNDNDLFQKEFFVKVNNKYLSQGSIIWPIYLKQNDGTFIECNEVQAEEGQIINFNSNSDSFLKFLKKLKNINISGNNINNCCFQWDENFFPISSSYATATNSYIEEFKGFNKSILKNPENLNFWFDLLDEESSIASKYSVRNIGDRKKVLSDDSISSIYYLSTPDVIFDLGDYTPEQQKAYNEKSVDGGSDCIAINIPGVIRSDFTIKAEGKSAYSILENLLYNYTYCTDQINISAIPIYYLQPNTIVNIYDKDTCIDGNYIIQKISYNLSANSVMSISGVKNIENNRDRKEIWDI